MASLACPTRLNCVLAPSTSRSLLEGNLRALVYCDASGPTTVRVLVFFVCFNAVINAPQQTTLTDILSYPRWRINLFRLTAVLLLLCLCPRQRVRKHLPSTVTTLPIEQAFELSLDFFICNPSQDPCQGMLVPSSLCSLAGQWLLDPIGILLELGLALGFELSHLANLRVRKRRVDSLYPNSISRPPDRIAMLL